MTQHELLVIAGREDALGILQKVETPSTDKRHCLKFNVLPKRIKYVDLNPGPCNQIKQSECLTVCRTFCGGQSLFSTRC